MYKKFVVGVIVLLIGVGIQSAFANDVYISKKTKDNFDEPLASDDYKEIITFIWGGSQSEWINRKGFFRGEIEIYSSTWGIPLKIKGLRLTNGKVERFSMFVIEVHANFFIGFIFDGEQALGVAFGDIEWVG